MWKKGNELAQDESAIVAAPGSDEAWMVRSSSSKRPHYVKRSKCGGGFICDDQCLSYKSAKVCSHSVALAVKLGCVDSCIKWYRKKKHRPNFTLLAEAGKPSNSGKKSKRKGVTKRGSKRIKKMISSAEELGLSWSSRCLQDSETSESDTDLEETDRVQIDTSSIVPTSCVSTITSSVSVGSNVQSVT